MNASKEVGVEVNTEKTKYMFLFCHQNARKNRDIETANRSFEESTVQIFGNDYNKSKPDPGEN
jgi:hypothetical protein